jgi:4-alpha-glucanotransferase
VANDFYFLRHEDFWGEQGRRTLTALLDATDLLACGEDLGLVPQVVPEVMADLGVLSLEIERMPKALGTWRADPALAPYASVVSPGTHDMAPLRLWWTEDPAFAQRYWAEVLGAEGPTPGVADPALVSDIIERQLASPAMVVIVPIQDLLAMDGDVARPDPHERINEPADRHHRWRYRLHLTLDDLAAATDFNERLAGMIEAADRR